MLLLIILSYCYVSLWSQPIEYSSVTCITREGSQSCSNDDCKSYATCPTGYTMTSCGIYSAWPSIDGSYIDGSGRCVAQLGDDDGADHWVKARAQCCTLDSSITCVDRSGGQSGGNDDDQSNAYCLSNEYITGCTVVTPWKYPDGAKPTISQKRCTAYNSVDGAGVWGHAQCCSYPSVANPRYILELECYSATGPLSGSSDDALSRIGCDTANNYFVAGCSGHRQHPNLDGWYTNNGNECIARNDGSSEGVYAYVICCREKKTWIPTKHPTTDPTKAPSPDPTTDPTRAPSSDPTKDPTFDPTIDPTKDPTSDPTIDPTTDPTTEPTLYPTTEPTAIPTKYPSTDPTIDPTLYPTMIPTFSPTFSPAEKLVLPTKRPTERSIKISDTTSSTKTDVSALINNDSVNGESDNLWLSKYMKYMIIAGIGMLLSIIIGLILCCIKKRRYNKPMNKEKVPPQSPITGTDTMMTTEMTTVNTFQPGEATKHIIRIQSVSVEMDGVKSESEEDSADNVLYTVPQNTNGEIPDIGNITPVPMLGDTFGNTAGNVENDDDMDDSDSSSVSDKELYGNGNTKGNEKYNDKEIQNQ